jgi:hypothetical protein
MQEMQGMVYTASWIVWKSIAAECAQQSGISGVFLTVSHCSCKDWIAESRYGSNGGGDDAVETSVIEIKT